MNSGCVYLERVSECYNLARGRDVLHVAVQEGHHSDTHVHTTHELGHLPQVVVLVCGHYQLPGLLGLSPSVSS